VADVTAETARLIDIGVRYFAAARAAAGSDSEELTVRAGVTVGEVVDELSSRNPELARVLLRCSYLCDGVAVHDKAQPLHPGNTIDILPPFAGG
jgi:sulfur-carrier protein